MGGEILVAQLHMTDRVGGVDGNWKVQTLRPTVPSQPRGELRVAAPTRQMRGRSWALMTESGRFAKAVRRWKEMRIDYWVALHIVLELMKI